MRRAGGIASVPDLSRDEVVPLGVAPTDPLEAQRTRLAYAVHDGLTQVVTASVLELDWLSRQAETGRKDAADALRTAATWLRDALEDIRGVLAVKAAMLKLAPGTPFPGIQHALGEGARLATVWPEPSADDIKARVEEAVYGIGPGDFDVPDPVPGTDCDDSCIDVTVNYTQDTDLLLFPGPTIEVSRTKRVWTAGT